MPIQHAIWKVGATPKALIVSKLATEKDLEEMITARPEMISSGWMLIGRQVRTSFGGIIDLLAIAPDGSLVLIELKRDKTPREIVAQASGFVRVEWLDTVPAAQAIWEVGFFANQNSVGRPRAEEWRYTVEKLKGRFSHWNAGSTGQ